MPIINHTGLFFKTFAVILLKIDCFYNCFMNCPRRNKMSDYKTEIGKRVSALRKLNGLTQENLAELLDCSVKHISHAERGIALLSLEKYLFLSEYFGCSLDYLLRGSGPRDVSSFLPTCMIEILQGEEGEDQQLLLAYLNMFAKIRNKKD